MQGLFDFLKQPEGQGLLSAVASFAANARRGAPLNSIGAGLLGGVTGYGNAIERKDNLEYKNLQMDSLRQQIAAKKRQDAWIANMLGDAPASIESASTALAQGAAAGSVGPTVANAQRLSNLEPMSTPNTPTMVKGIPREAFMADLALNQGKNLPDWMFKRLTPDMQVSNGYAYDRNNVQPGFMPGVHTSQTGQTSVTQPDGRGGITVSAPAGAMKTFTDYQRASEQSKAEFDLVKVTVPTANGAYEERWVPRSFIASQSQQPRQPEQQPQQDGLPVGNFKGDPQAIRAAIGNMPDPVEKSRAMLALESQLSGGPLPPMGANRAAPAGNPGSRAPLASAPTPTGGQRTVDEAFGKEYASWVAGGGFADIEKQLDQLRVAKQNLDTDTSLTGPVAGRFPDAIRSFTNPKAVSTSELVTEAVQRNLRLVLGAQFTEKEGERLISRAYNPTLSNTENARRVERLITQIETAAKTKADAAAYFEKNGTLAGWNGRLPTFADFDPVGRDKSGPVAQPLPKNATSANLRKGVTYDTPFGPAEWDGMQFKKR